MAGAGLANAYLVPAAGYYPAVVNPFGTIIANNTNLSGAPQTCYPFTGYGGPSAAVIASHGYNLDSGSSCGLAATGDISNTNPLLGLLTNNGGPLAADGLPPFTQALSKGSPAINTIPNAACAVASDERGEPRPAGSGCDIGAYEAQYMIYLPLIMR
jgi:hypothetical protein